MRVLHFVRAFLGRSLQCVVIVLPAFVVFVAEGVKEEGLVVWILHDWNDEDCVRILKKCKEAINNKGKVIVVDIVVMEDEKEEAEATETKLFFDLAMMATVTGKERTEIEWAKLFSAAGFTSYKITHVLGLRSVIELFL